MKDLIKTTYLHPRKSAKGPWRQENFNVTRQPLKTLNLRVFSLLPSWSTKFEQKTETIAFAGTKGRPGWAFATALEQPTGTWRVVDQLLTAQQTVPTPCFSEAVDMTRLRHTKSVVHVWTISSHQLCSEQYLDASNASKLDITKSDLKAIFQHQAFSPRCDLPIVDSIRSIAFFLGTWRFSQSKTLDSRAKNHGARM